jgi:4-amino-4-deoxy-L-arabinose transferase-like glycosyltransferase
VIAARRVALLVLVAAAAIFFRLHRIDEVPQGLFIDEAQDALDAAAIRRGESFPVMVEAGQVKGRTREPMLHYLMAGVFAVAGTSTHSIRLTVGLIGIVTVVLYYLLCDRLVGTRVAALAALFLAFSRWHVTMSRVGVRAVLTPLFIVLASLALERLVRRRSLSAAIVFGAVMGLGFYTYIAFWIVPFALVASTAVALATRSVRLQRSDVRLAAAALASFLIVMGPLLHYAATRPDYYFARSLRLSESLRASDDRGAELLDHVQQALFELHLRGDSAPMYNIPGEPLLDPVMGIVFLAGLYVVLKKFPLHPARHFALLAFWLLPLTPAILASPFGSAAMRSIGSVLSVCAIAAIGLDRVARLVAGRRRLASIALLTAALAGSAAWNYRSYFQVWGQREDIAGSFTPDVTRFYAFSADLAAAADVYLSPYLYNTPNFLFFRLERPVPLQLLDGAAALTASEAQPRDRVFIVDAAPVAAMIQRLYPDHQVVARYAVWGRSDGLVLRVAGGQLRRDLTESEKADAELWIGRMKADFEAMARDW